MQETQPKNRYLTPTKLVIDLGIFIAFLIAMAPRSSGIAIHEWLTVSGMAVFIVHLLLSWDWIAQITSRFLGKVAAQARINYILNWLLFIDSVVIMLSGLMISQQVMPFFRLELSHSFAWRGLHSLSTNLALLLLGVHTALHWSWVVNAFERYIFQPIRRLFTPNQKDLTV